MLLIGDIEIKTTLLDVDKINKEFISLSTLARLMGYTVNCVKIAGYYNSACINFEKNNKIRFTLDFVTFSKNSEEVNVVDLEIYTPHFQKTAGTDYIRVKIGDDSKDNVDIIFSTIKNILSIDEEDIIY